jgi:hypothetical protein
MGRRSASCFASLAPEFATEPSERRYRWFKAGLPTEAGEWYEQNPQSQPISQKPSNLLAIQKHTEYRNTAITAKGLAQQRKALSFLTDFRLHTDTKPIESVS